MIMPTTPKEKADEAEGSNWSDDQQSREYYYDDAHGYEKFDPETDKADDDPDEEENDEGANSSGGTFDVDLD